jgi:hypothetical protein
MHRMDQHGVYPLLRVLQNLLNDEEPLLSFFAKLKIIRGQDPTSVGNIEQERIQSPEEHRDC